MIISMVTGEESVNGVKSNHDGVRDAASDLCANLLKVLLLLNALQHLPLAVR